MGKKPDYEVFATTKGEQKTFYTKVGVAWKIKNEGIAITLQALPIEGSLLMWPPKEWQPEGR